MDEIRQFHAWTRPYKIGSSLSPDRCPRCQQVMDPVKRMGRCPSTDVLIEIKCPDAEKHVADMARFKAERDRYIDMCKEVNSSV